MAIPRIKFKTPTESQRSSIVPERGSTFPIQKHSEDNEAVVNIVKCGSSWTPANAFSLPEHWNLMESMSRFLSRAIGFRKHIINATSPSRFQHLVCGQIQWLSVGYANSTASNGHSFTVSYLVDVCGFSAKQAASASERVSFETRDKPDLVINFLQKHGLSQSQIARFIRHDPLILRCDPDKTLLPKIEFLKSMGVSSSSIPKLLCSSPAIMRRSLSNQLIPSFDFFRGLFQSDEKLTQALTYCSGILLYLNTHVVPNMKLLREAGVSESNVMKLLQFFPRALTTNTARFREVVEEVKELGFNPLKIQFVMAVRVYLSLSTSTRANKFDVYKKWGWSDHDILAAFRKYPFCMTVADDKIDAVMEFLVHKLGCEPSTINKNPSVLALSLKRRIMPRGAVIQALLSKGLIERKALVAAFIYTEDGFLRRFVIRHGPEAGGLLELYQSKLDLAR
ncbi:transcription termination factor MTERF5, chloroplastic-like [Neltuma alba]|uniref:transcription termination factor MTERF5, chloroplastic-like n=1 Tax=Neltuma alba TaxID=207710 RepID=UPI0010A3432B|nr:transcription termination factor MTERF5, chloroplastic-like [Prosopis alba]